MNPGTYLCLSVSDTGCGMEEDVMDRIFDPYFSTKEKEKGTGLGLAVVHGIIINCGGDIRVYSEPGKGSVFRIYFPGLKSKHKPGVISENKILPRGSERILLVDNEIEIVNTLEALIEDMGYKVVSKTSAIDALEIFQADSGKYDLVITDMTMPDMTGTQLAEAMMKIRSDIPVILCTGFSDQISAEKSKKLGFRDFLMKPFTRAELAVSIRRVLDDNPVIER